MIDHSNKFLIAKIYIVVSYLIEKKIKTKNVINQIKRIGENIQKKKKNNRTIDQRTIKRVSDIQFSVLMNYIYL